MRFDIQFNCYIYVKNWLAMYIKDFLIVLLWPYHYPFKIEMYNLSDSAVTTWDNIKHSLPFKNIIIYQQETIGRLRI